MNRHKLNHILQHVPIETVREFEFYYGDERFTWSSLLHEHNLQQAEKGIGENLKYKDINSQSGYSHSGIKKIKRVCLGIKNK
ncbi:MAG: hypothetical protein ACHQNT_00265 [Bacteroidia bacterium]